MAKYEANRCGIPEKHYLIMGTHKNTKRWGRALHSISLVFLLFLKASGDPSDSLRFRYGVLPTAFFTPETHLGVGLLGFAYFHTNKTDRRLKRSNTQTYLSYTLNRQFFFENDYQLWFNGNTKYLTGTLGFSRFPEFFYGIGNATKTTDRRMVSFDIIKGSVKGLMRFAGDVYGGLYFQYQKLYNQNVTLTTGTMGEMIPGGGGYTASGIGPILIFDRRNNPLNPSKGAYVESSFQCFGKLTGRSSAFSAFVLDARKYATLFKKLVWNGNACLFMNSGEVPYRMLPGIGGPRFLRGYYQGRFRDKNMFVLQQEFRRSLYKFFGLAVFGGVGAVAGTIRGFSTNEVHYSYGAGLRIRINKKENTNLRIDYGLTKDSHGLYVVFAEAF